MAFKDCHELEKFRLNSNNFIGSGLYGLFYKINDKECLKVFRNEKAIHSLESEHPETFLEYLKMLSEKKTDILVLPKDIYIDNTGLVRAYTMDYQKGIELSSGIDNIDINVFMDAIKEFYCELTKIYDLVLYNASPYNLILNENKSLKMINLDLARFKTWMDSELVCLENYKIFNRAIFYSILGRFSVSDLLDANLFELVKIIISGDYTLPGLLTEYIDYINKHYFEVKKVKDLRYPYVSSL